MTLALKLLLVAAGGGLGTICRYLLETRFQTAMITLVINLAGSFLMGIFAGWLLSSALGGDKRTLISVLLMSGFCGGFSTFAHFTILTVNYLREGALITGFAYILATVCAGLICCFGGLMLGMRFSPSSL